MKRELLILLATWLFMWPCCAEEGRPEGESLREEEMEFSLYSSAFEEGSMIPMKYTADGQNVSPPLSWSGAPWGTESFALIADDPDAPVGTWVHWVLYNIPATVMELPEGIPADKELENGAMSGVNDFRRYGYGGPSPPGGTHRYYFKIYALDVRLNAKPGLTKKELLSLMEGHILGQGQLMGKYKR